MFQIAVDLYNDGYDVHMYGEENITAQYTEANLSIAKRGVSQVAIFGHSHGGGTTYELSKGLDDNRAVIGTFTIAYTAYVDAIRRGGVFPETRRPPSSQYHVNIYETIDGLHGDTMGANSNEEFNVTNTVWGTALNHGSIDQDPTVKGIVTSRLRARVSR